MGFKVFQGQETAANLLSATSGSQPVFNDGSGDTVTFSLEAPSGAGGAKAAGQTATVMPVFVNEAGRDVIVVADATTGQPPVSATRTGGNATAPPTPGDWLVTPAHDNMSENRIDGADIVAHTPTGWQPGPSVKFTTSRCGLDAYIVTHRFTEAGKQKFAHVIISVRKRIKCHLFEMKKSATAVDTLDQYRDPLGEARTLLADSFGIDLVFPDGPIAPEKTTPFQASRNENQLTGMIPASNTRAARDLFINVVNGIAGSADGIGGMSQVHLESENALKWQKSYQEYLQSSQAFHGTRDAWANTFRPPLTGDVRKLAEQIADGMVKPDEAFSLGQRNLVLHEIGHAFGLVPTSGKAGGMVQDHWRDRSHDGHCGTKTCVMFFTGDGSQLGLSAQLRKGAPFDHPKEHMCTVYLFACDLSDIRRF